VAWQFIKLVTAGLRRSELDLQRGEASGVEEDLDLEASDLGAGGECFGLAGYEAESFVRLGEDLLEVISSSSGFPSNTMSTSWLALA
jgi:hypothetical protein